MANLKRALVALLLLLAGCGQARVDVGAGAATLRPFLDDLTSPDRFCSPGEGSLRFFSSYDRTGGNQDGHGTFYGQGKDGRMIVAEADGPGCVRRIWLTGMELEQKFYFYFDGESRPRLVKTYADLKGAGAFPFAPPFCDSPSGGAVCYLPIPFAKHLAITTDKIEPGKFFFYQVSCEILPGRSDIVSLHPATLAAAEAQLRSAAQRWRDVQSGALPDAGPASFSNEVMTAAGMTQVVARADGPGTIRRLTVRVRLPDGVSVLDRNRQLRSVDLRLFWDGEERPGVDVPLADFFCNGIRPRQFRSLPLTVAEDGYTCDFPMPFGKNMRVEVANSGTLAVDVSVRGWVAPGAPADPLHYFHAAWNQSRSPGRPHVIVDAKGAGQYVGCYLVAIGTDKTWNILEGDECMYLDGERSPSLHGTGLEDYFNGGWYYTEGTFTTPLAGCLERSPIRTTQYRFHVPDPIRFKQGLKVDIEFGDGNTSKGYMSSVAYWYSTVASGAGQPLPAVEQRMPPADPMEPVYLFCEVVDRERKGPLDEARDLCMEYALKYPSSPFAEMFGLRALACREQIEGYAAVSNQILAVEQTARSEEVRRQAGLLSGFHRAADSALLCALINGRCRVFLDGALVFQGDNPVAMSIAPVTLKPGRHTIAADVTATRPAPWFHAYVRAHGTNVWSDATWKMARSVDTGWAAPGYDDSRWTGAVTCGVLPLYFLYPYQPNAIVRPLADESLVSPQTGGWKDGETIYYRKTFDVP